MTGLAVGLPAVWGLGLMTQCARAEMAPAISAVDSTNDTGLARFDLIVQRNIFDPNRGMAPASVPATTPRHQPVVETFSFRGAAEKLGKGVDGFFAGVGVPTAGVVDVNDKINGFTVVEIGLHEVKLAGPNDEVVVLTDQMGLTREDGGAWTKIAVPTLYTAVTQIRYTPDSENPSPVSRPENVPTQNNYNNVRRNRNNNGRYNNRGGAATSQDDPIQAAPPLAQGNLAAQPVQETKL